jgi:FtsP/CotA-like multicopper oxidase with cupredoxin domain
MFGRPLQGVALLALVLTITTSRDLTNREPARATSVGRVPARAIPNDNRHATGRLTNGVLTLRLEAREAEWYPEKTGIPIHAYAFAEQGKQAQAPGPMIRVPVGTEIHATVRNALPRPLRIRGLQERNRAAMDSTIMAPGTTQEFRFRADVPGTYYYWGRTESFPANTGPGILTDGLLLGAFVVDSVGGRAAKNERVLVLSVWSDTAAALGVKSEHADRVMRREMVPRERWFVAAVNGMSWPHTERLSYNVGDSIRWRIINASRYPHPMHLHGFYFQIAAAGDAQRDTAFDALRQRNAVTEWIPPGGTMTIRWVPTRPGNWLYHCHIATHISDATRVGPAVHSSTSHVRHAEGAMAGLVLGVHVAPTKTVTPAIDPRPRRRLRLFVTERANVYGDRPGYSYVLQEGPTPPAADSIRTPSSTITLRQNEPTEIAIINAGKDMASIHWHGIELESFYDGVGDWSGWGTRVAPPIAPGDSFVVRLTPPRAGTFIYHTHTDEGIKLASGLYGTLLVLPQNVPADTTEQVFLLSVGGPLDDARPVINGSATRPPIELRAGVAYRFRFVNIAPLESRTMQLTLGGQIQQWRALAKDGADLPPHQAKLQPAVLQVHPGETYDFEVRRDRPDSLTLTFLSPETIANRAAFLKRADPREPVPRIIVEFPVIVR